MTVAPTDRIPIGTIDRRILLQPIDAAGRSLPEFSLRVTGKVVFDVAVEPPEIYAGVQDIGSTFEALLTLRSRTGAAFDITSTEQKRPDLAIEEVENDSDSRRTFRLTVACRQSGDQRPAVQIGAVNLESGEQATLNIPVSYFGARPRAMQAQNSSDDLQFAVDQR